ncbi:MAG: hypothetical protein KF859_11025 [Phycisphaeraceae bacterium]|nr:hypothetical protein [Phycisphaeraceae bacterium]
MLATKLVSAKQAKSRWSSPGGKTPEAILYAAILRQVAAKTDFAHF